MTAAADAALLVTCAPEAFKRASDEAMETTKRGIQRFKELPTPRNTRAALDVFRAGHVPVTGEAVALPLVELAGSSRVGDAIFDEIFHPVAQRLVERCDAVLRMGGPSVGADEMVVRARVAGKLVVASADELPVAA